MKPAFSQYSCALFKEDHIVFKNDKPGLRPIFQCVTEFQHREKIYELHDKIIGLAAAKLIIYGGFVKKVITLIISKPAFQALQMANILVEQEQTVDNILNVEKDDICPMEKLALQTTDNYQLFLKVQENYS